jgi:hypothetical protein
MPHLFGVDRRIPKIGTPPVSTTTASISLVPIRRDRSILCGMRALSELGFAADKPRWSSRPGSLACDKIVSHRVCRPFHPVQFPVLSSKSDLDEGRKKTKAKTTVFDTIDNFLLCLRRPRGWRNPSIQV